MYTHGHTVPQNDLIKNTCSKRHCLETSMVNWKQSLFLWFWMADWLDTKSPATQWQGWKGPGTSRIHPGIIRVWFYAKPLHHHWEHDCLTSPEASASKGWRISPFPPPRSTHALAEAELQRLPQLSLSWTGQRIRIHKRHQISKHRHNAYSRNIQNLA